MSIGPYCVSEKTIRYKMEASDPAECGSEVLHPVINEEKQPETNNQQMVSRSCSRCLCTQIKYCIYTKAVP